MSKGGDNPRRAVLKKLVGCITLLGAIAPALARNESRNAESFKRKDRMKPTKEREAKDVERLYSTKQVRVRMGGREYVIPVNHLTPKGASYDDLLDYRHLEFFLFLPDYGGFTKDNWQKGPFDERRIDVAQVKSVDKNAVVPISGGGRERIKPEGYGDPVARFKNTKALLEKEPSLEMYELAGYRRINYPSMRSVTWTGTRSNGEFFFFDSTSALGEPLPPGLVHGLCDVRYYSEKEDLFIAYRYHQVHLAAWRDIDDAIWQKIKSWELKTR